MSPDLIRSKGFKKNYTLLINMSVDISFWCERVQSCFSMFLKDPTTLQHLLLFGPPGSGKTTSASWLVEQIWGSKKPLMCISMNAADERSLESIRQKVFPFLRVDWRSKEEKAPRFLILDECETLTEAAQLSLQTILNNDSKNICVILICNSQSRIHPKLRQRLLKIRYDPPKHSTDSSNIFNAITRGDLRQTTRKDETEKRIWQYIHCHPSEISHIIKKNNIDFNSIITEIFLLSDIFKIVDEELLFIINIIYPLLVDGTVLYGQVEEKVIKLIEKFKQKFDSKYLQNIVITH
jgi:DNA polymerase III delta prime subunit